MFTPIKQSAVLGQVPTTSQLNLGELAINTADGLLFFSKHVGNVASITTLSPVTSATVRAGLGYTPVNKAGDTVTGNLSVLGSLDSPLMTTVTQPTTDVSTKVATTAFVQAFTGSYVGGAFLPISGGTLTGAVSMPTGSTAVTLAPYDNSTKVATTAFVQAQAGNFLPISGGTLVGWLFGQEITASPGVGGVGFSTAGNMAVGYDTTGGTFTDAAIRLAQGQMISLEETGVITMGLLSGNTLQITNGGSVNLALDQSGNLSVLSSITAPVMTTVTQPTTDMSTNVATTAFVQSVAAGVGVGVSSAYLPLAGGTMTGLLVLDGATTPTVALTDSSTKVATTAFVHNNLGTYAPLASPAMTGTPTAPTASSFTNNTQIATTAFAQALLAEALNLTGGTMTGALTLNGATTPTLTSSDNSNSVATTAFVQSVAAALAATYPVRATSNINLYVATTGSDTTGNGTVGSPYATIQHAVNTVYTGINLNGQYNVTVNVAAGTYTAGCAFPSAPQNSPAGAQFYITGAGSSSTLINVTTNSNVFVARGGANITVSGMTLSAVNGATGTGMLYALLGGLITVGSGMNFGACSGYQMIAANGGYVSVTNGYTISGGGYAHVCSSVGGQINFAGTFTVTITGTPAFSSAFAVGQFAGLVWLNAINCVTWSGSVSGARYGAQINGMIDTQGSGTSYFPGSIGGSTATGGLYI